MEEEKIFGRFDEVSGLIDNLKLVKNVAGQAENDSENYDKKTKKKRIRLRMKSEKKNKERQNG